MRVALVLGAGASLSNGLFFRSERKKATLPPLDTTFFETVASSKATLSEALQRYFTDFLGIEPTEATLRERRMEEVFADVFYDFAEAGGKGIPYTAYVDLVNLYVRILRETTNWLADDGRTGAPIGRLLAAAADCGDDVTVITFNHDLVIENEIERRARLNRRWCLDRGYGTAGLDLNLLAATARPLPPGDFGLHSDGRCDHDRPITVLKLHGSMNWRVRTNTSRPSANLLLGRARSSSKKTHLLPSRRLLGDEYFVKAGVRGRSEWRLWPVVVPPVYEKQGLRSGVIKATWADARANLETAERVVFFGYSLPALDIEAEKLFERALTQNTEVPWLDVVNPAPAAAARFGGLSSKRPLRWYPSVKGFLEAGGFGI